MQPDEKQNTPSLTQHTANTSRPGFNPPSGLPLQPPAGLPQVAGAGQTGLIAWTHKPKNRPLMMVIVLVFSLIVGVLVAVPVFLLGR